MRKVLLIMLLFAGIGAYSQNEREKMAQLIQITVDNLKYEKAIELANEYSANYPPNARVIYLRGFSRLNLNEVSEAILDFKKAYVLGYNNEIITRFSSKKNLAISEGRSYAPNAILDSSADYRIKVTYADTIRGMLRPQRTCYDVFFYDLTVKIIYEKESISGKNDIYFKVEKPTQEIQVDLVDNFTVDTIIWKDKGLTYKRVEQALFIQFPSILKAKTKQKITISYSGSPRKSKTPPWDGGFVWSRSMNGTPFAGVACEHAGASLWWPCKDHPADEPDSMRLTFQVPDSLSVIANGVFRSAKMVDSTYKSFEWFVSYPINNYDATFYMGNFVNFNEVYYGKKDHILMNYYVTPSNLDLAKGYYAQTKDVVAVYEEVFGPYPFGRDGIAMIESRYRGMEHQSAIAIGDNYDNMDRVNNKFTEYDYLVVHETAHEWWGNAVTSDDMADAWIQEGFATYAESLFDERKFGYPKYLENCSENFGSVVNLWPVVGRRDVNDNTFITNDIYYKGATMLACLRCLINNDFIFFDLIQKYYAKYCYKTTNTKDFIKFVKRYTGKDYKAFFKKFLYEAEPPILEYYSEIKDSSLTFTYRWANVDAGFEMPFCIILNDKTCIRLSATVKKKTYKAKNTNSFYIPFHGRKDTKIMLPNSFTYFWLMKADSEMF